MMFHLDNHLELLSTSIQSLMYSISQELTHSSTRNAIGTFGR
jgi:hypothetical protein